MTREEFRLRFPEFRTASDGLIDRVIGEAVRSIDPDRFGDQTDDAVGYLAADLLTTSPFGKSQRLEDDKSETTYRKRYLQIRQQCVLRIGIT